MNVIELPIDEISFDGGTQAREAISEATVTEYADALTDGETLPPVVVFFDGVKNHLADGFHRLHANRRIGARTVACDVRAGTLLDALLFAYGANKSHGLRRTNADKRKAVLGMLTQFASWSDRNIAKHVGVDGKTVAAQREAHCGNSAVTPAERTYTTKHGTTATMNVAGQKAAGKAKAAKEPAAVAPEAEAPAEAAASAAPEAGTLDEQPPEAADPRDEHIAELRRELDTALADNTRIGEVFDADDKLAAAMAANSTLTAKNKELEAQVAGLRERVTGLMNESNQQIRRIKALMAKLKKAGIE